MDFNIDTALKMVWVGFIRIGELTYTMAEVTKAMFVKIGLTKSDISFIEDNQYAILPLKQSKTNTDHNGMQIILTTMSESICSVAALRRLFIQILRLANAPLFKL